MPSIDMLIYVTNTSSRIGSIGGAVRRRGPLTVETWAFYSVSQQKQRVIDRSPRPELNR
jgi:hypothetical protein